MLRVAHISLLAQIVLAPLMLGGDRPWALAILMLLTGTGILAACQTTDRLRVSPYIKGICAICSACIIWSLAQSLPIWPMQAAPFTTSHIALFPTAWQGLSVKLIWLCSALTLASLLAQRTGTDFTKALIKSVVLACALQLMLAAIADLMSWQSTFWSAKTAHIGDWTGSFANRNAFGALMAIGVLGSAYLFVCAPDTTLGRRLDQSGVWLALATLFVLAVFQSHSRSALIMTVIGFAILIPLALGKIKLRNALPIFIIATLSIIALLIVQPEGIARFGELFRADLIQRDDAWQTAILAILGRPLTGFGPDSIALVMSHYATPALNTNANWFSSHNLWLDGAIMFGLPFVAVLFAGSCWAMKPVLDLPLANAERGLVFALTCVAVIGSMTGWVISMPALILPIAAIVVGLIENAIAQQREAPEPADHLVQSPTPDPTAPN